MLTFSLDPTRGAHGQIAAAQLAQPLRGKSDQHALPPPPFALPVRPREISQFLVKVPERENPSRQVD